MNLNYQIIPKMKKSITDFAKFYILIPVLHDFLPNLTNLTDQLIVLMIQIILMFVGTEFLLN